MCLALRPKPCEEAGQGRGEMKKGQIGKTRQTRSGPIKPPLNEWLDQHDQP
jgi:hypothetical protein